jgi:transketolase
MNPDNTVDAKEVYGRTLIDIAKTNDRVVAVEADLMKASGSGAFREAYPDRHFNVGIAEQNLLGFSAGLASMGMIPYAATFACFISQRSCDQLVNSVAYNNFNVKMVGAYAGLTSEKNGGTHISVLDISICRSTPRMVVADPADAIEFAKILRYAADYESPFYVRQNKGKFPVILPEDYEPVCGKAVVLREGSDIGVITTGIGTQEAVKACEYLSSQGISARLVHMPFIKPIDAEAIVETAEKTDKIITVENHSVNGGLGSAVAEVLSERRPTKLVRLGLQDVFGETAPLSYLIKKFKIDAGSIIDTVKEELR